MARANHCTCNCPVSRGLVSLVNQPVFSVTAVTGWFTSPVREHSTSVAYIRYTERPVKSGSRDNRLFFVVDEAHCVKMSVSLSLCTSYKLYYGPFFFVKQVFLAFEEARSTCVGLVWCSHTISLKWGEGLSHQWLVLTYQNLAYPIRLQVSQHRFQNFREKQWMEWHSLYSTPFYTCRHGYKMCARIYLNGDGLGKGTHLSFFFVIMCGPFDSVLTWPFNQRVMLNQVVTCHQHIMKTYFSHSWKQLISKTSLRWMSLQDAPSSSSMQSTWM